MPIAALLTLSAVYAAGCGGDDDNTPGGTINPGVDSGRTDTGTSGNTTDGGTSSSSSSSSSSGSIPDSGTDADSGDLPDVVQALPVGGTVSGLGTPAATGLVLTLNGANDLAINNNGGFTFPTAANLLPGTSYTVAIKSQPTGRTCTISAGSGTVAAPGVSNVVVNCDGGTFTIGGAVTGLAAGASVVLTNNGLDDLTVNNGNPFAFATPVGTGAAYNVQVKTNPSTPSQTCVVTNGTGTVASANVTNIAVACTTTKFKVNVAVTGLAGGSSVVLSNNGGDSLTVNGNNTVAFPTSVDSGAAYAVTVQTQPTSPAQTCTVGANATGTIGSSDVTVAVTCSSQTFTVGGTVTGLDDGKTIVLADTAPGTTQLTLTGAGGADVPFTFGNARNSGSGYNVSIATQPTGQTCTVAGGSGTIGSANVSSIQINCATGKFAVGGSVTGLAAGSTVTLSNGTDSVTVNGNGPAALQFPALNNGTAYTVTVTQQPLFGSPNPGTGRNQTCTVANGTGTVNAAAVENIAVTCLTNSFTYAGQVHGLADGQTITITDNGSSPTSTQTKSVTGAAGSPTDTFTFDAPNQSGSSHTLNVTSPTAPISQTCVPTDTGSGSAAAVTVANGPITSARIDCTTNKFPVSVNVTGLTSGQLNLALTSSGGNTIAGVTSSGTTTPFGSAFDGLSGTNYTVTVDSNPTFVAGVSAAQTCTVTSGGTGVIGNASPVVNIACTRNAGGIGGQVSGLDTTNPTPPAPPGSNTVTVRLVYTGVTAGQANVSTTQVDQTVNANGPFSFPISAQMASNTAYTLTVEVQPTDPPQTCRFSNGTGTQVGTASGTTDNAAFSINCSTNRFALNGVFDTGPGLELPNFNCTPPTVLDSGTLAGDLANVAPNCGVFLRVAATGVTGDSSAQWIRGNTADFSFSRLLTSLNGYTVTVESDPQYYTAGGPPATRVPNSRKMTCTVASGGTGTVTNHDLTATSGPGGTDERVHIACSTDPFTVGGSVSGWEAGSNLSLRLTDNGPTATAAVQDLAITANGVFTFPTSLRSGNSYTATLTPANTTTNANGTVVTTGNPQLVCTFGTGTATGDVMNANVTTISVTCARARFRPVVRLEGLNANGTVGITLTRNAITGTAGGFNDEALAAVPRTFTPADNNADTSFTLAGDPSGLGVMTIAANGTYSVKVTTDAVNQPFCRVMGVESNDNRTMANSPGVVPVVIRVVCAAGLTCQDIKTNNPSATNGTYWIDPDGKIAPPAIDTSAEPFQVDCDMTSSGGGWTMILRATDSSTFAYTNTATWTTNSTFGTIAGAANAKLASYSTVPFTQVRVVGNGGNAAVMTVASQTSMLSAQNATFNTVSGTGPTLANWTGLISGGGSLQSNNVQFQGLNVGQNATFARVRIGAVGEEIPQGTVDPDSFIGIGGIDADSGSCTYPLGAQVVVGNRSPSANCGAVSGRNTAQTMTVYVK